MFRVTVTLFSLLVVAASSRAQEHHLRTADRETVLSKLSAGGDLKMESIRQVWDGQDWVNGSRNTYAYDDSGLLETDAYDTWTDGAWAMTGRSLLSHDQLGQHIETVAQQWSGSEWTNSVKNEFLYDDDGNMVENIVSRWNEGAWGLNRRTLSTFNALGQEIEWVSQDIVTGTEDWANKIRKTRTYDEVGNLVYELEERWDTATNDWMTFRQTTFEFDGNNNLTSTLEEDWKNDAWENDWVETRAYDENGFLAELLWQNWDGGVWVNDFRELYTNDETGNWVELILDVWDNGAWMSDELAMGTWDARGNLVASVSQTWDGNAFVNSRRTLTTYQPAVGTAVEGDNTTELPAAATLDQNYPNPFNPSTRIDFTVYEPVSVRLAVYDALGREIAVLVDGNLSPGRHSASWNAARNLGSGTYFYQVRAAGATETRTMLLAK